MDSFQAEIDRAVAGTIPLQRRLADLERRAGAVRGGIEILSDEELSGVRGGDAAVDGAAAAAEARAEALLRIEKDLATERERIERRYSDRLAGIEAARGAASEERIAELIRRATAAYRSAIAELEAELFEFEPLGAAVQAPIVEEVARHRVDLQAAALAALRDLEDERERETRERRARELLEAQGFHTEYEAQEAAHQARLRALRGQQAAGFAESLGVIGESLRNVTGAFGQFAGESRRAFRLQQAASLATAIVSTAEGVSRALGAYAPPLNFVLAGTVAAAGAAQIAAIRAQEAPTGFRYGGIIDRRTEFGYGDGRRGFAGEAGPEAILPLARTARGELGVRGTGGGDRIVRIDVGSIVVRAPEGTDDPEEFGRAAFEGLLHQARPVLREFLIDEQRPGGALNRTDRAA